MKKRKFDAKLRKVGNSYVVTIPKDTIERFKIKQGEYITVELDLETIIHKKKLKPQKTTGILSKKVKKNAK